MTCNNGINLLNSDSSLCDEYNQWTFSREKYQKLFDAISLSLPIVTTTFVVPDLRGKFIGDLK